MKKKKESFSKTNLLNFFKTLPKYNLPWFWILAAFLFNIAFNQVLLGIPSTTANLLNGSLDQKALWAAISYYLIYGLLSCIQALLMQVTECYSVYHVRKSLWHKMLYTKICYYDENEPSELMSTITNDVNIAIGRFVNMIIFILPDIFYLIQAFLKISQYHITLVLAELTILPLKYIYMIVLGKYTQKATLKLYDKIGKLTSYLAERINHLTHIKSFNSEEKESRHGQEASYKLYEANLDLAKIDCLSKAAQTIISVIEKFIVMMAAVFLLQKKMITMQQWVAFFLFSTEISFKFDGFVGAWITLKMVQGSATRSVVMLNAPDEKQEQIKSQDMIDHEKIEFKDVCFSYGNHQALRHVSFSVDKGTSIGIVGLCGSGKTTILNLLERFYETDSGHIYFEDNDIKDIPLNKYRHQFSYVQQGADIFNGTVKEAMTYGIDKNLTDEDIMNAAKLTGIDHYIKSQPLGLNTELFMGSDSLSGGQNQRLVLAREILRDRDIILMDEPTSALDIKTSQKIRELIQDIFADKTKIVVTHDLDLAKEMDKIIVLDQGVCVGQGTYLELMQSCTLFQEMMEAHLKEMEATE